MTGSHTVQLLLKRGHTVRAIAHNEDERSMRLQELGAEVVIGDLLNLNDVRLALSGIRGCDSNYHDASDMAELVGDISTGADNWATHLVTSGGNRAATFEMILIVSKIGVSNRNWHSRCSNLCVYEIFNRKE